MSDRSTMNGKPVITLPATRVINFESGFQRKLLCDGPAFSTGNACAFSCAFCYVPEAMRFYRASQGITAAHEDIVLRRAGALEILRGELVNKRGQPRFANPEDRRVIYASPLVDVAANMTLVRETAEACALILRHTHWQIRLLSKSHLLPRVAELLCEALPVPEEELRRRLVFGASTGTLEDGLARAFEEGCPLVSKRIESLHALQDAGFRTYGMVCPSLPQRDYAAFASRMAEALRADRLEHVWAEVVNVRGQSMERTVEALRRAGHEWEAEQLQEVANSDEAWEKYNEDTFEAHARTYAEMPGKLRFLTYVREGAEPYWKERMERGAVPL